MTNKRLQAIQNRRKQAGQRGATERRGPGLLRNLSWDNSVDSNTSASSLLDFSSKEFRSSKRHLIIPDVDVVQSSRERAKEDKIRKALPSTRLQFERVGLCGRREETRTLKGCLCRMVDVLSIKDLDMSLSSAWSDHEETTSNVRRELILLGGESGCGKSALAMQLKHSVEHVHRGTFCVGKYELSKKDVPMLGLIGAATQICQRILPLKDTNRQLFRTIQTELKVLIGDTGLSLLSTAVSDISKILEKSYLEIDEEGAVGVDLQKRLSLGSDTQKKLEIAFCIFFRIVCDHLAPVVMILDDLQWCSDLSVVKMLLRDADNTGLMVVGCFRSNEVGQEAALSKAVQDLTSQPSEGLSITEIDVGNLSLENTQDWLSELLSKDAEEVEELALLCHGRTQGNIFFMRSFLSLLVEDGLMKFDIGSFCWDWNIQDIQEDTSVAPNLVEIIQNRMSKLHDCAIELMTIASCLGSCFAHHALWLVWKKYRRHKQCCNDTELFDNILELVIKANCLEHANKADYKEDRCPESEDESKRCTALYIYRFSHDKIQEASMSSIPLEEYQLIQHLVGSTLLRELGPKEQDQMMYLITDLLNVRPQVNIQLAQMNLKAALAAKSVAAFSCTAKYVQYGIQCLPKDTMWEAHLALAIKLHSLGAVAELNLTNMKAAEQHCMAVISQSKVTPLQKCTVYRVKVLLSHQHTHTEEALELCLDYLAELGCRFPRSKLVRKVHARPYLQETKAKYIPTEDEIEQLPYMTDEIRLGAQFLLEEAGNMAYAMKDTNLLILIRCRHVRWIKKYGLTNEAPSAYASLANILMHLYGQFDAGKALAELSMATQSLAQDKYAEARTLGLVNQYILGWTKPLQSQLHSLFEGYQSGMKSGNTFSGCSCLAGYMFGSFQSGTKMSLLEEDCQNYLPLLDRLHMFMALDITRPIGQLVENLLGKSGNTTTLTGSIMDEEDFMKSFRTPTINFFLVHKSLACMYFGAFETAAQIALKLGPDAMRKNFPGFGFGFEYLPFGLSLFAMARKSKQSKYSKPAMQIRNSLEGLVRKGCINLVHQLSLLDAESHALNKRVKKAKDAYCRAAIEAARGGFQQDAGLVNERYADYLLELGDTRDSTYHMEEAIKCYSEWGATKKVELLMEKQKLIKETSCLQARIRRATLPASHKVVAPPTA